MSDSGCGNASNSSLIGATTGSLGPLVHVRYVAPSPPLEAVVPARPMSQTAFSAARSLQTSQS
eukprot:12466878-Alexandrium_andersonii.AAC.1